MVLCLSNKSIRYLVTSVYAMEKNLPIEIQSKRFVTGLTI